MHGCCGEVVKCIRMHCADELTSTAVRYVCTYVNEEGQGPRIRIPENGGKGTQKNLEILGLVASSLPLDTCKMILACGLLDD